MCLKSLMLSMKSTVTTILAFIEFFLQLFVAGILSVSEFPSHSFSIYQKWLDIREKCVFWLSAAHVMLKMVFFSCCSLEGLEVGDAEQSLADCFPKCEGCCVCLCGSTTLQIMIFVFYVVIINQRTQVTITNMQSHRA